MELLPGQQKVVDSFNSRQIVFVGVRWGKTTTAIELAIKKCKETPSKVVRLYANNYNWGREIERRIIKRLQEENLLLKTFREYIVLTNTSRIVVDVLPWRNEDLIFDDAFSRYNVTIFETPIGWKMTRGPTWDNPYTRVPPESRTHYSKDMEQAMFDGIIEDEWERFKKWSKDTTGEEPKITRSMFNRCISDPFNEKKVHERDDYHGNTRDNIQFNTT